MADAWTCPWSIYSKKLSNIQNRYSANAEGGGYWRHLANMTETSMCGRLSNYSDHLLFMATLWYRAGHYFFALWFLSIYLSFLSSPNLSGRRLDVYHTSTHGVALVRI